MIVVTRVNFAIGINDVRISEPEVIVIARKNFLIVSAEVEFWIGDRDNFRA